MTERSVAACARKIARNSLYGLLHPKFASDWLDELGGSYQEYLLRKPSRASLRWQRTSGGAVQ